MRFSVIVKRAWNFYHTTFEVAPNLLQYPLPSHAHGACPAVAQPPACRAPVEGVRWMGFMASCNPLQPAKNPTLCLSRVLPRESREVCTDATS